MEVRIFYQCLERFKDLLNAYSHYGYENWHIIIIIIFYEALIHKMWQFVETMCNKEFFNEEAEKAFAYFNYLAKNTYS